MRNDFCEVLNYLLFSILQTQTQYYTLFYRLKESERTIPIAAAIVDVVGRA